MAEKPDHSTRHSRPPGPQNSFVSHVSQAHPSLYCLNKVECPPTLLPQTKIRSLPSLNIRSGNKLNSTLHGSLPFPNTFTFNFQTSALPFSWTTSPTPPGFPFDGKPTSNPLFCEAFLGLCTPQTESLFTQGCPLQMNK